MNIYNLNKALPLLESFKVWLEPLNYCCGLTGSVLFQNYSTNDIDIIVYPLKTTVSRAQPESLMQMISDSKLFGNVKHTMQVDYHEADEKTVYFLANDKNQRFNFFFLE